MSNYDAAQEGSILKLQRIEQTPEESHHIDETKFQNWQMRWDSKEAVIDHLLDELEKSMLKSSMAADAHISIVE